MDNPLEMLSRITSIESDMEKNIHDLVWMYGSRRKTKDGFQYTLSTKWLGEYAKIRSNEGNCYHIKKVVISNPEKCQIIGHIWLIDENGSKWGFNEFYHQQFNIYCPLYHKTLYKPIKNQIERK